MFSLSPSFRLEYFSLRLVNSRCQGLSAGFCVMSFDPSCSIAFIAVIYLSLIMVLQVCAMQLPHVFMLAQDNMVTWLIVQLCVRYNSDLLGMHLLQAWHIMNGLESVVDSKTPFIFAVLFIKSKATDLENYPLQTNLLWKVLSALLFCI